MDATNDPNRQTIRIDDLRRPILTDAHLEAMEHAERNPVQLTVEAVLSAARQQTRLHDFGSDDFRSRLQRWLSIATSEPNRTPFGRSVLFDQCVQFASTRLRLNELLRQQPQIHELQIRKPIIVVGPFRSGTTHLLNLLAMDSRLRSLPLWEGAEPIPDPSSTRAHIDPDPRISRWTDNWRQMRQFLPNLAAMRPLDPGQADEEFMLQGPDFPHCLWQWITPAQLSNPFRTQNQRPHYQYLNTMLKALQWQRGPDRWVLKSPHHAEHLRSLMATFPDATIVITHRDPISVVQSVATLAAYYGRLEYREIDTKAVGAYWMQRIETMLRTSMNDRKYIASYRIVDVYYQDFMADELRTVQQIYAAAGLDLPDEQREQVTAFQAQHPLGKHGRVSYDLQTDFGIDPTELRSRFGFYYDQYPIEPQES